MISSQVLLAGHFPLPDLWGEGALFAPSGLDGPTCSAAHFVLTYGSQPYDLLVQTAAPYLLRIRLMEGATLVAATGDVLAAETAAGDLIVTFCAWHTAIGQLPPGAQIELLPLPSVAPADPRAPSYQPTRWSETETLALQHTADRFALAYGETPQDALARAQAGLAADLAAEVSARLAFYAAVPRGATAGETRFLRKCASVMKVNTLGPEGAIRRRWSTPDRAPHQHMWLWDSVFHSFGMNRTNPELAWEFLLAVLEAQRPDGMIPHMMTVTGHASAITQPPLLAWGVWENYGFLRDRARLAEAFPRLEAYLAWNLAHRDRNANGLLEWRIEENAKSRSGESGMDNSPRFDAGLIVDAVDFSAYQAHDMFCLSQIAAELGLTDRAVLWGERGRAMAQAIHARLWDEATGFYFDRDFAGDFVRVRAVSGFTPLLLPDLPAGRTARLEAALRDPRAFAAACPIPSVALDEPTWSTDMWRGAAWINMNYLVIEGLRRQGCHDTAARLAAQTAGFVRRAYESEGVLHEFFDARNSRPHAACDRKGPPHLPYDFRAQYGVIRDYHWTAALILAEH
jgi:glycogen debranching enzyme